MKFTKDDIGKRVLLSLDPKTHDIAKALGASEVSVQGDILDVADTYLEIGTVPRNVDSIPAGPKPRNMQVPYDSIIGYKFVQYVRHTGKTYPIIVNTGKSFQKVGLFDIAGGLSGKKDKK